jgi:hypothetical protein
MMTMIADAFLQSHHIMAAGLKERIGERRLQVRVCRLSGRAFLTAWCGRLALATPSGIPNGF